MKKIFYWELEFDPTYFSSVKYYFKNAKYETREEAVKAVEELKKNLEENFLSNWGRKILHQHHKDLTLERFKDRDIYSYRIVTVDKEDYTEIIQFGCTRKLTVLR